MHAITGQNAIPGEYATAPNRQSIIAMGAGATASLSAFDNLIRTSAPA